MDNKEKLLPYRTKSIWDCDPDYRKIPKTDYFCIICQKDIDKEKPHRMVRIIKGGDAILHPKDCQEYVSDASDCGWYPIGNNCAKKIGMEWSHGK